jgi:hypothetical protein
MSNCRVKCKVGYTMGHYRSIIKLSILRETLGLTVGLGMLWVIVRLTVKVYCGLNFRISNKDKNALGNCRVSC